MANKIINSLQFNSGDINILSLPYGICETAADTAAKAVTVENFALETGAQILVKFTVTNSASSPTLNINGTGAKNIMYRGSAIGAGHLAANRVYEFVYDGTDWELVGDLFAETSISVGNKSSTDTTDLVYAVTNLVESGTKNHTITPTYTGLPTKTYVDKIATGHVKYLGTVAALTGLSTTAGQGDFYRVSTAFTFGSETAHVGDIILATKDNPAQNATDWDLIHAEIDSNSWVANTASAAGYVAKGSGNANKVWKPDGSGNPAWRDDANTTYTFNGAVSTIKDNNLTAGRALISSSSGKVAVSETTSTELGYVHGVTSAIQTQLNSKIPNSGDYTNKYLSWNSSSYLQNVILLIPVLQSNNWSGFNYIDGRFFLWKTGGNVYDVINVNANCVYDSLRYHLEMFGDHPTATLCVCKYNNILYYAIKCPYHANPYTHVTFTGRIKSELSGGTTTVDLPLQVPYYDENSKTVLNAEVKNSITDTLTTTYVTSASGTPLCCINGFKGSLNGNASTATTASVANGLNFGGGGYTTDTYGNFVAGSTAATWNIMDKSGTTKVAITWASGATTFKGAVTAPTFAGALSGNASTATSLATARTISISDTAGTTGTSFNGTANVSLVIPSNLTNFNRLTFSTSNNTFSPTTQSIVLNGVNNSDDSAKAPGIGFHIGNKNWASLKFLPDGTFRFYNNGGTGYQPVYASTFYGNLSGNATTATNVAWSGVTGKPSYYDSKAIKGITRSGTTFTYTCMDGTTGTFTQQDNNTTYSAGAGITLSGTTFSNSGVRSVTTGSTNGTISVNTNGTSANVAVKGLGSAAYTASTAYATAAQGTKADNALPKSGGTMTGTIITPGNDTVVIRPAKNNYDQIGSEDYTFWKIYSSTFNGQNFNVSNNLTFTGTVVDLQKVISNQGSSNAAYAVKLNDTASNNARGKYSIAAGYYTQTSSIGELAIGCCAAVATSVFKVGNGYVASNGVLTSQNAAYMTEGGVLYLDGSVKTSGADYAEYFEWEDGNHNAEDRRGYFVTLSGEKIKIAKPGDFILGIISAQPTIVGNGDIDWQGRFLKDEFGSPIMEIIEYIEGDEINEETGEKTPIIKTGPKPKQNPKYDPNQHYISREERPEWDAVGMMGVLPVRDDGTCQVNSYCKVTNEGTATASNTGYRVIARVNDHVIKIVLK